ncbi:hypothetical protein BKA70DRAFT_1262862 [Coprinopsis sp. MPI-PUGE-AT-0042]|nr:hypothetical protein BKA70DRAFT_1262862 [Coprinopsis sp. MPI-PUGE-AT-0042]
MNPSTNNGRNAEAATESELRTSHDRVQLWMASLKGEMMDIMSRDVSSHKRLAELEPQMADVTRSYGDLQRKHNKLLKAFEELKKSPRSSIEAHRIVVLVDGDGALFNFELIEQGKAGGGKAATKIMESIKSYSDSGHRDETWVYVFLNKKGLRALFQRHKRPTAMEELDDFIVGMNEAAKTIMVVDVGQKKEAADSKIKALLESEVRSLETRKVFFAGSHDNGYVTELRAQVTAGFKEKLVLIPSYTAVASGYKELNLPTLNIPGLFMLEKLPYAPHARSKPTATTVGSNARLRSPTANSSSPPASITEAWSAAPSRNPVHSTPRSDASPTTDPSHSQASSLSEDCGASTNSSATRILTPGLPLSKQTPPPCTLHYLVGACKFQERCKYGHEYILEAKHYDEMRKNAKKTPCQAANNAFVCSWGDKCCYGHQCPSGKNCHYFKLGKCKFLQKDMHRK